MCMSRGVLVEDVLWKSAWIHSQILWIHNCFLCLLCLQYCLSVCLSVFLVRPSVSLSVCLLSSVRLSSSWLSLVCRSCPSVSLSVCLCCLLLPVCLSLSISLCLSVCLSSLCLSVVVSLSVCLSLSLSLSLCLSVCLSLCLSGQMFCYYASYSIKFIKVYFYTIYLFYHWLVSGSWE